MRCYAVHGHLPCRKLQTSGSTPAACAHARQRQLPQQQTRPQCMPLAAADAAADAAAAPAPADCHNGRVQQQQRHDQQQHIRQQQHPHPPHRRGVLKAGLLLAAAAVAAQPRPPAAAAAAAAGASLTIEDVTPSVAPRGELGAREQAVISIFEAASPAVVSVFDVTILGRPAGAIPEADVPEGNGSGIVWDAQGNVVTNYHVLQSSLAKFGASPNAPLSSAAPSPAVGKRVALVTLQDASGAQHTYDATLVGADRARDLAVLRLEGVPPGYLKPLQLGSSEAGLLRVGQLCLAIGNPFGFDHTLTSGVISGLNRDIKSQLGVTIPGGIQTDAAINPGNSGGPLLDSSGRLIGLNTAIFTPTGTSAGVGFAIPVATVARVVPQLISSGRVLRPSLGVQVSSDAVASKLKVAAGALLAGVEPGGPAAAAGLLPTRRSLGGVLAGDVIVALNGRPILNGGDLFNALEQCSVGDAVSLSVLRATDGGGSQALEVPVQLAAAQ